MADQEILIIDDEQQIRKLLEISLSSSGYRVRTAATGRLGITLAATHQPDMIILDLGLPDSDGHSVLKQLREWFTKPVLILSVISNENDIIAALDNGANDYLCKPFRTGELLARIRSALRGAAILESDSPILDFDNIQINLSQRAVYRNGELIKLTVTEYSLLVLLARNEGKVLTHQYMLRDIWGPGFIHQTQYLRVFIAQLRKKIEDDPNHPKLINTESGVGYRFITSS
jgi:two-component system, OmpR family, KDP operon response regulator KdpE